MRASDHQGIPERPLLQTNSGHELDCQGEPVGGLRLFTTLRQLVASISRNSEHCGPDRWGSEKNRNTTPNCL